MRMGHRRIPGMNVLVIRLLWAWLCHFVALFIYSHDLAWGPVCSVLSLLPDPTNLPSCLGTKRQGDLLMFCSQFLHLSPRKAVLWLPSWSGRFSPDLCKKCREQAIWRHIKAEGHTSYVFCTSKGGGWAELSRFLLAKVTLDRGLINGATFTGTFVRHFDICKSFV